MVRSDRVGIGLIELVIGRVGLIEPGIGLIELGIGLIGLGIGLIELRIGLIELGIGLIELVIGQIGVIELRIGLIELRIGLLELGIGLMELWIGLRIDNAPRTVLARVSGLVKGLSETFFKFDLSFLEAELCCFLLSVGAVHPVHTYSLHTLIHDQPTLIIDFTPIFNPLHKFNQFDEIRFPSIFSSNLRFRVMKLLRSNAN